MDDFNKNLNILVKNLILLIGDLMLYINPLTLLLIIFFTVNGNLIYFLICYASMLIHELSHLSAALIIGLKPERFSLHPYGVSLTLKNKIIYSYLDEVILYLSGPFANILLSLFCMILFGRGKYSDYFYVCNLLLFFMNILPVSPLDGGALLKKTLMRFSGIKQALKITRILSLSLSALFFVSGIFIIKKTGFNASVLIMSALLFVNTFSQDEKYSVDFLREFLFHKEKRKIPVHTKTKIIVADKDYDFKKLAESFKFKNYTLVFLKDNDKIKAIKSESEIIDEILNS